MSGVSSSKKPIKIGVVGAGVMSQKTHLPILQKLQTEGIYDLVVICDLNIDAAKEAKEKFSFSNYATSIEQIWQTDLDALYIFNTGQMHYELGLEALNRGLHIFIEKPPAPDTKAFQVLVSAARKANKFGVVGLNRRFQKNIDFVKREVEAIGLYAMEASFHKPVINEAPPHGAKTWLPINAIHSIDVLLYMQGSAPAEIYTATNSVNTDLPQNFSVLLIWADKTHAVLSSDYSAGSRVERYVFHGYDTSYYCDPALHKAKSGLLEIIDDGKKPEEWGFDGEHRAFAEAILNGEKPRHDLTLCLDTVHITELIEQGYSGVVPALGVSEPERVIPDDKGGKKEKVGILVCNATGMKSLLPGLKNEYDLYFVDTLNEASPIDRRSIRAIFSGPGGMPITKDLLDMLPNLEVAGIAGASLKSYPTDLLLDRDVVIFNASDVYADSVAEFIVMQAILGVREASRSHDIIRSGGWGVATTPKGSWMVSLRKVINCSAFSPVKKLLRPVWQKAKKTGVLTIPVVKRPALEKDFRHSSFGIIGQGEITKKLIPHLHHFGCAIKIHSDYLTDVEAKKWGVEKCSLDVVLNCDVVSMQRGLSDRTKNSFTKEHFAALKNGSVFINTARAGIIDEEALLAALKEKRFFACLDVFHREPLARNDAIRSLPNVFLSSHIAACSRRMRSDSIVAVTEKVTNYLEGQDVEEAYIDRELLKNMT